MRQCKRSKEAKPRRWYEAARGCETSEELDSGDSHGSARPLNLMDEAIEGGVRRPRGRRAIEGYQDQGGQQLRWRKAEFSLATSRPYIQTSHHHLAAVSVFHHSAHYRS